MNVSSTLELDRNMIEGAEIYARKNRQSLSLLIENYFRFISEENNFSDRDISPLVRELSGIIKIDDEFDLKQAYADHLTEKYK